MFNDFTRINNEQVNIIRTLSKENERLMSELDETPVSFYEELSKLNNDLVNMQRELAKKKRELDELVITSYSIHYTKLYEWNRLATRHNKDSQKRSA